MDKLKLKLDIIKSMLNYAVIAFFGSLSYLFINYDNLSTQKTILLSFAVFGSMVGVAMFLYVYFKNLKEG